MIEVFRTNVDCPKQAEALLDRIHNLPGIARANFDLQDCDRILRIQTESSTVQWSAIVEIVRATGFFAEILPG